MAGPLSPPPLAIGCGLPREGFAHGVGSFTAVPGPRGGPAEGCLSTAFLTSGVVIPSLKGDLGRETPCSSQCLYLECPLLFCFQIFIAFQI